MINITRNEEVVLNQIKIFNIEYPEGIPLKLLKSELGFHEYDLVLSSLAIPGAILSN